MIERECTRENMPAKMPLNVFIAKLSAVEKVTSTLTVIVTATLTGL